MNRTKLRHVLADGRVLIILQLSSRRHSCYIVEHGLEPPTFLVEGGTIAECRDAAADCIRDDVLEVM